MPSVSWKSGSKTPSTDFAYISQSKPDWGMLLQWNSACFRVYMCRHCRRKSVDINLLRVEIKLFDYPFQLLNQNFLGRRSGLISNWNSTRFETTLASALYPSLLKNERYCNTHQKTSPWQNAKRIVPSGQTCPTPRCHASAKRGYVILT